ncbi:putative oxidoreductase YteT [Watersipora subatra]|uniref:putative oxidoreductase YteT n=1 Tax=Watersipora subatra TaxID=2589382 RepID=UPI00355B68E4
MATTAIIVGAGNRGSNYAEFATFAPDKLKIVGVAEPIELLRNRMVKKYSIKKDMAWDTWEKMLDHERLAEVAIITTQDRMHKEPAVKLAAKGYHILLEKPMAVTYEDCCEIVQAVKKNGVMFGVCHVLRYYPQYIRIRELIESGEIGEVYNIQHTEPVGFWHYAHAFVRGNWRNESKSSSSLLVKCCHDLDLINYWMGNKKCTNISSFGSLMHFTATNKPANAGLNCLSCPIEETCAYSAKKIYLSRAKEGNFGWPVSVVTKTADVEDLTDALRNGQYGRCVYDCDNDVMSNQVVSMQFIGGATATLTMVAFTERVSSRQTVISGSKGEITCDFYGPVKVYDFLNKKSTEYHAESGEQIGGHNGADHHLMVTFIDAVRAKDQSRILAGPDETLYSHRLVFAAEKARLGNRVVSMEK